MASLFTSLEPASHGVVTGAIGHDPHGDGPVAVDQRLLPESLGTIAESFRAAGYRTVGVAANSHLAASLGFAQGFDAYVEEAPFMGAGAVNQHVHRLLAQELGAEWRSAWKRTPTFLWVHYFDPHAPYDARSPWAEQNAEAAGAPDSWREVADMPFPDLLLRYRAATDRIRAEIEPLYQSEIRWVDEHVRALGSELGLSDPDVMVIVTSDHGEELGEHGGLGHGTHVYEEGVRVPFFIRWPSGLARGVRSDAPVTLLDVFPTLASLLELDPPGETHGIALPLDDLGRLPATRPIYLETRRSKPVKRAIVVGDDKLVLRDYRHRSMRDRRRELFDLGSDPVESRNLADARGARATELAMQLMRHYARLPGPPRDARSRRITDPTTVERLRQLGYGD